MAAVIMLALTPQMPLGDGVAEAASGCSPWANAPYYSGSWAYGTGGMSCDGAYQYGLQVCLRKQRDFQPDEDTSCTSPIYSYTRASNTVSQCGANGNYRTRAYTWYSTSGAGAGWTESGWAWMSAGC